MDTAPEERDQNRHDEVAEAIFQEADVGDLSVFKGEREKGKIAFPMKDAANFLLGGRNYKHNTLVLLGESSAKESPLVKVRGKKNIWINFYQLPDGRFAVRLATRIEGSGGISLSLKEPVLEFYAREVLRLGFEQVETRQRKFRVINIDTGSFHAVIRDDGFIDVTPKH